MKSFLALLILCSLKCIDIPTLAADAYRFEEAKAKKISNYIKYISKSKQFQSNLEKFKAQKEEFQEAHGLVFSAKLQEENLEKQALIDLDITLTFSKQTLDSKGKIQQIIDLLSLLKRSGEYLREIVLEFDKDFEIDVNAKITELKVYSSYFLAYFKNFEDHISKYEEEILLLNKLDARKKSLEVEKGYLSAILSYLHEIESEEYIEEIESMEEQAKQDSQSISYQLVESTKRVIDLKLKTDSFCEELAEPNYNFLFLILENFDKFFRFFLKEEYSKFSEIYQKNKKEQKEELSTLFRKNNLILNMIRRINLIDKITSKKDEAKLLRLHNNAVQIIDSLTMSIRPECNTRKFGFDELKNVLQPNILKMSPNKELAVIIVHQLFFVYFKAIKSFHVIWNFIVNITAKSARSRINYAFSIKLKKLKEFRVYAKLDLLNRLSVKEEIETIRKYWKGKKKIEECGERMLQGISVMIDRINWWPVISICIFVSNCLFIFWLIRKRIQAEEKEAKENIRDSQLTF